MSDIEDMKDIVDNLEYTVERLEQANQPIKDAISSSSNMYEIRRNIDSSVSAFRKKVDENINLLSNFEAKVEKVNNILEEHEKANKHVRIAIFVSTFLATLFITGLFLSLNAVNINLVNFFLSILGFN
jgi:predicted RNase H-like nuclease (RuvC/YqgF family)